MLCTQWTIWFQQTVGKDQRIAWFLSEGMGFKRKVPIGNCLCVNQKLCGRVMQAHFFGGSVICTKKSLQGNLHSANVVKRNFLMVKACVTEPKITIAWADRVGSPPGVERVHNFEVLVAAHTQNMNSSRLAEIIAVSANDSEKLDARIGVVYKTLLLWLSDLDR